MSNYRKLIVAGVGVGAFVAKEAFGVDLGGVEPMFVDLVIGGLTLFGVWRFPNEKSA